jgi:hypothetical protein
MRTPGNQDIADVLERVGALLDIQGADGFRVRAYRRAARTIRELDQPAAAMLASGGPDALERLPTIGPSIASTVTELVRTGRLRMLDRLEGQTAPEDLFTTLPGIGEELAGRLHDRLGIDSLEELEVAAHDGRLEALEGFGPRRVLAVRQSLAAVLGRSARQRARAFSREPSTSLHVETAAAQPPVATLLELDAEYRRRAEAGSLRTIPPRRFNPRRVAWLPIWHVDRDGWIFTVVFSNTATAHRLRRTRDWVVEYFERDGDEGQSTVVTETHGPLAGRRVVRGREAECAAFHETAARLFVDHDRDAQDDRRALDELRRALAEERARR